MPTQSRSRVPAVIKLDGSTSALTANGGISNSGSIIGAGTITGAISGAGIVQASGGTLDIKSAITDATVDNLRVDDVAGSILRIDGTVVTGATVAFDGATGVLDLTNFVGGQLTGFGATVAGMTVGDSSIVPTTAIELAGLARNDITSLSLDTVTDVLTVTDTTGSFTIQLSGTYAPNTVVNAISDVNGGVDLFLATTTGFTARGAVDSWLDAISWSNNLVPSQTPAPSSSFTFGNIAQGPEHIYIPGTLRQATGTGNSHLDHQR